MLPSIETYDEPGTSLDEGQSISDYKQKDTVETQTLSPLQQRKSDALELAKLIYKIYNDSCPVSSNGSSGEENENV